MSIVLGIDLGTSFSCAAAVRGHSVVVAEDDQGRRTMPSIVHFASSGRVVVGHEARPLVARDPAHTIISAKRFLGRRYNDGALRIARNAYFYKVIEGPNSWPMVDSRGGPYTVAEVCACILQELKIRAEAFFGEPIRQAVITVPANADDAQREQTRIAGKIAGLEVLRLLNEPTAAALAYALGGVVGDNTVVYDFGGGTFDCSVIRWGEDAARVLATHGDSFLGGDDIDRALAEHIAKDVLERYGVELRGRVNEWRRLLLACEEVKRGLSRAPSIRLRLPEVAQTKRGPLSIDVEITRETLERLAQPLVLQTVELMLDAVALGGLELSQVDEVVLVGGSSRLSAVRRAVADAIGRPAHLDFDPDTVVAMGAAIEAQRLLGGSTPTLERAPRELVDVVPRSIGLATAGGGFDPIIRRNSSLPAKGQRVYSTWRDGQTQMRFVVLQGDHDRAELNARLGEFVVKDLPPRPAGQLQVELSFEVSGDGLLRASARDTTTNHVHRYRVRVVDSLGAES
jgi:molecular chaperone DnaK